MRQFNRKHDTIYWYSIGPTWTFNADNVRLPHHAKTEANYRDGLLGSGHADTPLRPGKVPETWWTEEKGNGLAITPRQKKQYVGYPTQKPLALLERIIKASTGEEDIVFDPFCGCATACVAAEKLNRQWVGIDLSQKAVELVAMRTQRTMGLRHFEISNRTDIPQRTDQGIVPNYRTRKHELYGRQEGRCICNTHFPFRNFTIDHIIPQSKKGGDHIDNLMLLCGACNSLKGNRDIPYLLAALKEMGIKPDMSVLKAQKMLLVTQSRQHT